MRFSLFHSFVLLFVFIAFSATAQKVETTHILYQKDKEPIEGNLISIDAKNILFSVDGKAIQVFDRAKVTSLVFKSEGLKEHDFTVEKKKKEAVRKKENNIRKHTSTPTRISITPTAFTPPKGQIYYRNSGLLINEFMFASKYAYGGLGFHAFRFMLRGQINLPISKFIYLGLASEVNFKSFLIDGDGLLDEPQVAFIPILTIGTTDYFFNIAYRSKGPIFLPINDTNDDNFVRLGKYWSFGGGIKIGKRFQFLSESLLIEDKNQQKHYRIYLGFAGAFGRHTLGLGVSIYDTDKTSTHDDYYLNLGSNFPSIQYTARFN